MSLGLSILFRMYSLGILIIVFMFIGAKAFVFHKAQLPWIFAFIPVVSLVCMTIIAFGRTKWYYVFLMMIPLVNLIFIVLMLYRIPLNFDQNSIVGVLNVLFSPLVMCYLAFSGVSYHSPDCYDDEL